MNPGLGRSVEREREREGGRLRSKLFRWRHKNGHRTISDTVIWFNGCALLYWVYIYTKAISCLSYNLIFSKVLKHLFYLFRPSTLCDRVNIGPIHL